jgi:hypothetical protein
MVEKAMASIPFAALVSALALALPLDPPKSDPPASKDEGPDTVEQHWKDLAGGDAQKAYSSIWAMVKSQTETVSFLKAHLHPVAAPDAAKLQRLIGELDDSHFAAREKASAALENYGELAEPALREALGKNPSTEVRRRLETLLSRLDGTLQPGETLQAYRAIEVLEHIGTLGAQEALQALAGGAAGARITREAKASLDRIARRMK